MCLKKKYSFRNNWAHSDENTHTWQKLSQVKNTGILSISLTGHPVNIFDCQGQFLTSRNITLTRNHRTQEHKQVKVSRLHMLSFKLVIAIVHIIMFRGHKNCAFFSYAHSSTNFKKCSPEGRVAGWCWGRYTRIGTILDLLDKEERPFKLSRHVSSISLWRKKIHFTWQEVVTWMRE